MMNTLVSEPSADTARRTRILDGATSVFLAYGFQRTTMDDIAKAAEISRPALYLMFRNKTDIYRALATTFMDEMIANARDVLVADGPLEERIGMMLGCALDMVDEIEAAPHGADILDMKNSLAGDIIATCRNEMIELVQAVIGGEAKKRGCDLAARGYSARALADMLLDAVDGMKLRQLPATEQRQCVSAYLRIVANAVAD